MVTIIPEFNFCGDKLLCLRVPHCNYSNKSFISINFVGFIFCECCLPTRSSSQWKFQPLWYPNLSSSPKMGTWPNGQFWKRYKPWRILGRICTCSNQCSACTSRSSTPRLSGNQNVPKVCLQFYPETYGVGCCKVLLIVHLPTFKTYVLAAGITDRKYTKPTLRYLEDSISVILIRLE